MKTILIFLLLSLSTYSQTYITRGISTFHTDSLWDYNNQSDQIGVGINNFYFQYMINSFGDPTVSLSYNMYLKNFYIGFGVTKGYKKYYTRRYRQNNKNWIETATYIPYIKNGYSKLLYVGYKINISENTNLMLTKSLNCVNILVRYKIR